MHQRCVELLQVTNYTKLSDRQPHALLLPGPVRDHQETPDCQSHAGPAGGHSACAGKLLARATGYAYGMHQPLQHPPASHCWKPTCLACVVATTAQALAANMRELQQVVQQQQEGMQDALHRYARV